MSYLVIKEEGLKFSDQRNVLKVYLYVKMIEKGLVPFDNDLDILSELYFFGGYDGNQEKKDFYKLLLDKKLRGSEQSISNKLTELSEMNLILRADKNCIKLNTVDFFPEIKHDITGIGLILKVYAS